MTYEQVKNLIPGNRRWCKWTNCLYLQRWRGAIRFHYGYRYRRSQVIATWYPNGRFKFASQCYYPSHRSKIGHFMPDGFEVISHRYYSFLREPGENIEDAKAFYVRSEDRHDNRYPRKPPSWCEIKNGKVLTRLGEPLWKIKAQLRAADITRDIPRRSGRYWLRKARGIYRKNICGKSYYEGCAWKKIWPKPTTNWIGECGCEVYIKKARSRDTVATIMSEENSTVRTAKIQIYGVEKFFTDAGAKTIHKEAGYELLTLDTGRATTVDVNHWRMARSEQTANVVLTALRMECSTTGKIYVNTVPPEMITVSSALDWMFNTTNYLGKVGKQT